MPHGKVVLIKENGFIEKRRKAVSRGLDPYRCSGKTTSLAIEAMSRAMGSPGREIDIRDHFDSRQSHVMLAELIMQFIKKLKLDGFTIDFSRLKLTFEL